MNRGGWFRSHKRNGSTPASIPDGLWSKCPRCSEVSFAREVERNLYICPKCDYHHAISARQRIALTVDEQSFEEHDALLASVDPLGFPGYQKKLEEYRGKTGLNDAIVTGTGRIEGRSTVIAVGDFGFNGGSMGSVVGEKIVRAMEHSIHERLPLVMFASSGGARMQEGLLALMQMAKTSAACARLDRSGIPYIVVLTHPTVGGVYASFASLGDIVIAEPGATVGLAGRRVGNQDMGVKLPDDFQTSEFQLRCGMVDRIVSRKEMRGTLGRFLAFFAEDRTDAQ
jgi:acetyl-CoA carboxylase carboxyl transferase subunit beta